MILGIQKSSLSSHQPKMFIKSLFCVLAPSNCLAKGHELSERGKHDAITAHQNFSVTWFPHRAMWESGEQCSLAFYNEN